tara:strand:+ start:164 stop:406 length:243 start_codon:yes stop_codon:yes gene_type:complete
LTTLVKARRIWSAWRKFGQTIGDLIARIILSVFYFTIFVPFALGARLLSDPLNVKAHDRSIWWLERETRDRTLDDARRQF